MANHCGHSPATSLCVLVSACPRSRIIAVAMTYSATDAALAPIDGQTSMPRAARIMAPASPSVAEPTMSTSSPGTGAVLGALTDTQLQRYNVESIALMQSSLKQWSNELSTADQSVTPYFIQLDFESIADPETRVLFNNVATSLALPAEEVDNLVEAGHRLLRQSPEFHDLVTHVRSMDKKGRASTAANLR